MNEFQQVIKAYLDQRAQEDAQFAANYAKQGKSIDKCCNYILRQAKKRGNAVAMPDDEVYGLAVHYYDEDIPADECKPVSGASRVNAPKVELTEEEKAAAREQAEPRYTKTKGKYLGIVIKGNGITLKPLQSVREFYKEAAFMHHCVYSRAYYDKPDSLILSAKDKVGKRIETVEFDLRRGRLVQ